MSGFYPELLQR